MLRFHREILKEFKDLSKTKIILFGSVARGDYTLDSDMDIAVITNRKEVREEAKKIADRVLFKYGKVVSIKFLTEKELRNSKEPLVKEIKKGILWKKT